MLPFETESSSPLGPLLPEHLSELFVGIALFLIIWFVIAKKVAPVFEKTYTERAEAIQGGIEKAEVAQREAAAALAEYNDQLASAREEAARIREEARQQGATIAAEIKAQAQAESARIIATAKAQIDAERAQVVHQLRAEVGGLATDLAGRIVGESLADDERAQRSVERFIAELESNSQERV